MRAVGVLLALVAVTQGCVCNRGLGAECHETAYGLGQADCQTGLACVCIGSPRSCSRQALQDYQGDYVGVCARPCSQDSDCASPCVCLDGGSGPAQPAHCGFPDESNYDEC